MAIFHQLVFYVMAFALALGMLVVIHELGHFMVARLCGVKVLRFSVGFGKVLWLRRFGKDDTEWALALIPLGGFVRMLDEREAPVAEHELARAFNRQSVWKRFAIVAAGPLSNLLLAIVLYWLLFMQGTLELRALIDTPPPQSPAAIAGMQAGEEILRINNQAVETWQDVRWQLVEQLVSRQDIALETVNAQQELNLRHLPSALSDPADLEQDPGALLGLLPYRPRLPAIIGEVTKDSAAARAGMKTGDRVLAIDGQTVQGWSDVVQQVRAAPGKTLNFVVQRGASTLAMPLQAATAEENGQRIGRIGVGVQALDEKQQAAMDALFITKQYDFMAAGKKAWTQTWDMSTFTLKMMGRMLTGELSWKNISGPVTIADYAGRSAQMGWVAYLNFIALISISLGVLNLLPIPILDGGHLLYYVAEIVKGGPLSERVMEIGQQIGLTLLLMLMAFAFYNDINRLVSG